jgi:hypothetical protein
MWKWGLRPRNSQKIHKWDFRCSVHILLFFAAGVEDGMEETDTQPAERGRDSWRLVTWLVNLRPELFSWRAEWMVAIIAVILVISYTGGYFINWFIFVSLLCFVSCVK